MCDSANVVNVVVLVLVLLLTESFINWTQGSGQLPEGDGVDLYGC